MSVLTDECRMTHPPEVEPAIRHYVYKGPDGIAGRARQGKRERPMTDVSNLAVERIVAVLRDTAKKASEQETYTYKATPNGWKEEEQSASREKYSRDWIAGRVLGIADALEALLPKPEAE